MIIITQHIKVYVMIHVMRHANHKATSQNTSATGTRTRGARVRAEYPDQLDYSGFWQSSFTHNIKAQRLLVEHYICACMLSCGKNCSVQPSVHCPCHVRAVAIDVYKTLGKHAYCPDTSAAHF